MTARADKPFAPRGVDRRQLEYFLAVVDHGSYTRAADSLFLAQSALSHGVRKLERSLGGQLFERVNRGLQLTEFGKAAVGPARNALMSLDAVEAATAAVRGLARAHLTICTISTLSFDPTSALVGQLRTAHPGVTVQILAPPQSLTSAVAEVVTAGHAEIGVSEIPAADTELDVIELPAQEMQVVLPPAAAGHVSGHVDIGTVLDYGLVVGPYWESSSFHRLLVAAERNVDRHISVRTHHRNSFVSLAMAGAGATFVGPAQAERARRRGAVVASLDPPIHRPIAVVHRPGYVSPAAELFLRLCREMRAGT